MKNKSGMIDDVSCETDHALSHAGAQNARPKYESMTAEDFLERARNAERILENCRKSLQGV